MVLERRELVLISMIGGLLGTVLAAALFGAGMRFERRRHRPGRNAGQTAISKMPPDPQAEQRRRQWEDWMGFLHYDGTPQKDGDKR